MAGVPRVKSSIIKYKRVDCTRRVMAMHATIQGIRKITGMFLGRSVGRSISLMVGWALPLLVSVRDAQ